MRTRAFELPLTSVGSPPSSAQVEVGVLDQPDRLRRAGMALAGGLVAALVVLPIPIVHFFAVPGALIAGVVLAARRLRDRETFKDVRGRCPHCGGEQQFNVFGGVHLPKRVDCPGCHHDLYLQPTVLEPTAASGPPLTT
jgi:hypothetical protein